MKLISTDSHLRRTFTDLLLAVVAVLIVLTSVSSSRADLIITYSSGGLGMTNISMVGTLSTDSTLFAFPQDVNVISHFRNDGLDQDGVSYINTPDVAAIRPTRELVLSSSVSPGKLMAVNLGTHGTLRNSLLLSDDALGSTLQLLTGDDALLILVDPDGLDQAAPMTISYSENLVLPHDISVFNTGTWSWGTPGGAVGDGITLNVVPEPSSLLLGGVLMLGFFCRRRPRASIL